MVVFYCQHPYLPKQLLKFVNFQPEKFNIALMFLTMLDNSNVIYQNSKVIHMCNLFEKSETELVL